MEQQVISEYTGDHGFTHRNTPNADTGVMTALGSHFGRLALARHALDWRKYGTGWLECYAAGHGLSGGNPSCNAAGMMKYKTQISAAARIVR